MASRGFRIDIEGIERVSTALGLTADQMRHAIQRSLAGHAGEALLSSMKARTPVRTGTLKGGEAIRDMGPAKGVTVGYQGAASGGAVANGREQRGVWVESGTKPHAIRAKHAKALLLTGSGREVFSVQHPGAKGQRVAEKSLRAERAEMTEWIVEELNDMARECGWTGGSVGL